MSLLAPEYFRDQSFGFRVAVQLRHAGPNFTDNALLVFNQPVEQVTKANVVVSSVPDREPLAQIDAGLPPGDEIGDTPAALQLLTGNTFDSLTQWLIGRADPRLRVLEIISQRQPFQIQEVIQNRYPIGVPHHSSFPFWA
jgi:hypothetical protein